MTSAKEMNHLAEEARKGASLRDLRGASAVGTISGREVRCSARPTNTNGRQYISLLWYIDGAKASKAKVAAL